MVKKGLFFRTENGELFPVHIKLHCTATGKFKAIFNLEDPSKEVDKKVINEFKEVIKKFGSNIESK